jgi:bifunctional DNase/RNase
MNKIEMYRDSLQVSLMNYQRTVILKEKDGKRVLVIFISADGAKAIKMLLQNNPVAPNLANDFIYDIINKLGATLKYVVVDKLVQETFYAKTVIDHGSENIEIDCRPSDAFAIALRAGVPIYVTEEILSKVGVTLDSESADTSINQRFPMAKTETNTITTEMSEEQDSQLIKEYIRYGEECCWCFAVDLQRVKAKQIGQYYFPDAEVLHFKCDRCGGEYSNHHKTLIEEDYIRERIVVLHPELRGYITKDLIRQINNRLYRT